MGFAATVRIRRGPRAQSPLRKPRFA